MVQKTKTFDKAKDQITETAMQAGVVLMTAAVTLGLIDVPNQPDKRVVLPSRPVFATVDEIGQQEMPVNQLRRERDEEAGPHYVSYTVAQRTPGRTGKY